MKLSRIVGFLVMLPIVAVVVTESVAVDKKQVNAFYGEFRDRMKRPQVRLREVALLVKKQRPVAEKCLSVLRDKQPANPNEKEAIEFLRDTLGIVLLATKKDTDCSPQGGKRLMELGKDGRRTNENRIFLLENALRLCPSVGNSIYAELGDLYMRESQFGMAKEAYCKALEANPKDADSRKFLRLAENGGRSSAEKANTARGKVSEEEVLMAPVLRIHGGIRRKVEIRATFQTQNILFDEWSAVIRKESKPELKQVAASIKKALQSDPGSRILIEGHTDERGSEEANLKLSEERAKAVRDYLVQKEHLDPSRLHTKGCGPWSPFSELKGEAGWKLNRRVEFKKFKGSEM